MVDYGYYDYFKKALDEKIIQKIVNDFFNKHGREIVRDWLKDIAFCILEDYNTASCDEYLVAGEMARSIVQPLYDYVEKIENEIQFKLLDLFFTYRPKCSNCRYFIPSSDPRIRNYVKEELAHDEGYCVLFHRIVCDDDICRKYDPSENIEVVW